jgi:hypothetical protein
MTASTFLQGCGSSTVADELMTVGVVHNGSVYTFGEGDMLTRGCGEIAAMGARMVCIYMGPDYDDYYALSATEANSLLELAQTDEYRHVFSLPFEVYAINCYSFASGLNLDKRKTALSLDAKKEYAEIHALASYLLTAYGDKKKVFVIKNHYLLSHFNVPNLGRGIPDDIMQMMKAWLEARSSAVREANAKHGGKNSTKVLFAIDFHSEVANQYYERLVKSVTQSIPADMYATRVIDHTTTYLLFEYALHLLRKSLPEGQRHNGDIMFSGIEFPPSHPEGYRRIRWLLNSSRKLGMRYALVAPLYDFSLPGLRIKKNKIARSRYQPRFEPLIDSMGRRTRAYWEVKRFIDQQ